MIFISLTEEHADFEMYRDKNHHQLTRVTRFKGICPIYSSDVIVKKGDVC
jgi:hypothetical protein